MSENLESYIESRREHPDWSKVAVACGYSQPPGLSSAKPSDQEFTAANDFVRHQMQAHFPEGPHLAAHAHWEYARWLEQAVRSHMRGPAQTDLAVRWATFGRAASNGLMERTAGRTARPTFDMIDDVEFTGVVRTPQGATREDPFRGIAPHEVYGALRGVTRDLGRIAAAGPVDVEVTDTLERCRALVDRMDRADARPRQKGRDR